MSDDDRLLAVQLSAINDRLDRSDQNTGKVFDSLNSLRVTMERQTTLMEENQRRFTAMERNQAQMQKRISAGDHAIDGIRNDFNSLVTRFVPVETHVKDVSGFVHFFIGLPKATKLLTLFFSFVIGAYGVVAIFHSIRG
jgi:hypothetical protein